MKIIFYSLLAFSINATGQNLVPNPDFEGVISSTCGIDGDLESSLEDWNNPNTATPLAYYTSIDEACYNYQPLSTYPGPIGIKGNQAPHSGEVMVGLWIYTIPDLNQRQYVQVELTENLVVEEQYIVSFYTSLADNIEYGATGLGAYLSTDAPSIGTDGVLDFDAQVVSTEVILETEDWVLISDTITATEAMGYITIGHFNDDAATTLMANETASGEPGTYGAYYFVDDISVELFIDASAINENEIEKDLMNAFLDPTTNILNVGLIDENKKTSIQLYNSIGQIVYSNDAISESNIQISMASLESGLYILKCENDGVVQTIKIVK
ncbi:MAG: T9SS type A sorting domain-containing protein [Crocinitomix sp.]|nr:T9SS type A sorting domain-containing protein [Crocinitomix sp.]